MVDSRWNTHFTATTVPAFARNEKEMKNKDEMKSKKKTRTGRKTEKNGQEKIKARKVVKEEIKIIAKERDWQTSEKPDEPYQDILAFLTSGEALLFQE